MRRPSSSLLHDDDPGVRQYLDSGDARLRYRLWLQGFMNEMGRYYAQARVVAGLEPVQEPGPVGSFDTPGPEEVN